MLAYRNLRSKLNAPAAAKYSPQLCRPFLLPGVKWRVDVGELLIRECGVEWCVQRWRSLGSFTYITICYVVTGHYMYIYFLCLCEVMWMCLFGHSEKWACLLYGVCEWHCSTCGRKDCMFLQSSHAARGIWWVGKYLFLCFHLHFTTSWVFVHACTQFT